MNTILQDMHDQIAGLPVYDTHTHLIGGSLAAKDFWDIGHYFWFLRELMAAGYPAPEESLSPQQRREEYARAFAATANTSMNWVVRRIAGDLYGLTISDAHSIAVLDEAVRASAVQRDWPKQTAARGHIEQIVVNRAEHAPFPELPRTAVLVPRIDAELRTWLQTLAGALINPRREDIQSQAEATAAEVDRLFERLASLGCPGIMTTLPQFDLPTYGRGDKAHLEGVHCGTAYDRAVVYLLHCICRAAEANGLFVQFFLGVEHNWSSQAAPVNDPERVVRLHGLFDTYACSFELVVGSEVNNLDVVQAARIFPNTAAGGLWWYNFRASSYRDAMHKRMEALPGLASSFVASDARCIEWTYGKIALIKALMAEFLSEQIERGWLNRDAALQLAGDWLYHSAQTRYQWKGR